ncbi:MAG: radical SAM protein [Desulfurococcales archaeon]|nr:radical SAM protein [Desulfurococcales archaeon]
MVPVSVMVTGRGTVSTRIKGKYGKGSPSKLTSYYRPVVFWNITYRCNLRCIHCYINASPQGLPGEVDDEKLASIAGEISELKLPLIVFTGGEPLARKSFWIVSEKLSESLKGTGLPKLALSSNGTLITGEVAGLLKNLGFSYVGISIDSPDPEEHDRFRGARGAFNAAIEGIRASMNQGIDVGIRMTLTRQNIAKASKVVELAEKLGVPRVSLYILDSIGRAVELRELFPTREQLRSLADELVRVSKEKDGDPEILIVRGNFLGIYLADRLSKTRKDFLEYMEMLGSQGDCGRKTISIYPDGTVKPCQFIEYINLGDLKRESLRRVLSPGNPRIEPFVNVHKVLRGPKCSRCPFKAICGGGSRNRALVFNGDLWGDDPLCPIDPFRIASKWNIKPGDLPVN